MRNRFVAIALTMTLLGACSSSVAAQPVDDFLDKVEAQCVQASKKILKLTAGQATAPADLLDIMTSTADSLGRLQAPEEISKAYKQYTSSIDDLVTELGKATTAIAAGDTSGAHAAVAQLDVLRTDNDQAVNALSISSCRGLMPAEGLTGLTGSTTSDTTSASDNTGGTTQDTTIGTSPDTTTADTPISIDTTPIDTTPIDTSPTPTTNPVVKPADLSALYSPPTGFTWITADLPDVGGLYRNPTIGSLVTYYGGATLSNDTNSATSTVYVVKLSTPFTPEYTTSYQYWEVVDQGTDVTTPAGLKVREKTGAFTNVDCAVYVTGSTGIAVCVATGQDLLGLMDTWVATNPP